MPQLQPVVLKDRATPTPVDHTFTPRDIRDNVGAVVESTGSPIGDKTLTIGLVTNQSTGRKKVTIKLNLPVVANEVVNGVSRPVLLRYAFADISFSFAKDSLESERNDAVGLVADMLKVDKVLIHDTLVKLQGVY